MSISVPNWLTQQLDKASLIVNDLSVVTPSGKLCLGIDLGTSNIMSVVLDSNNQPVAVLMQWADVVRDGVVLNFHGAVNIVRHQLDSLQNKLGKAFEAANTSFPPGTDPRISVNVLEAAGLHISAVVDEPSAVAALLDLRNAAVVDIGGGTTGIAVLKNKKVVYSGDEPTGGHHVSLTIAGHLGISLEEAEALKINRGEEMWPVVEPVFEKMADIVRTHLKGYVVDALYLSGGSCSLAGVAKLFQLAFPDLSVLLPSYPIFLTPMAIAAYHQEA
ncbi:MAG: ethanolamine utilization protein EutJ [Neisseriales bacterium]|nr:MAG: ethanolamine utilization protein EutJ [Neisseriales bacterium]